MKPATAAPRLQNFFTPALQQLVETVLAEQAPVPAMPATQSSLDALFADGINSEADWLTKPCSEDSHHLHVPTNQATSDLATWLPDQETDKVKPMALDEYFAQADVD